MFLCRDTAFCRSSILYANASHLPGEAIRIRKYIHLIHSRCNEIEYVLSLASLSFLLFSSFSPPAFSSSVFFSFLCFLSFTPFQPELFLTPPSNAPLSRLFPPVSRPPLRRQPGNQPASQSVRGTSFRRTDVPPIIIMKAQFQTPLPIISRETNL